MVAASDLPTRVVRLDELQHGRRAEPYRWLGLTGLAFPGARVFFFGLLDRILGARLRVTFLVGND